MSRTPKRSRGQHGRVYPWTATQTAVLLREWTESSSRKLSQLLRPHTWVAIRLRAKLLGLALGIPQGRATATRLGKLFGVDRATITTILARKGVAGRHALPCERPTMARRFQRVHYDIEAAREAFEAWLAEESSGAAAARLGIPMARLNRRARRAGLGDHGRPLRLMPEQWDQLARPKSIGRPRAR